MDVRAGHLPDPYQLDVAYAEGQPIGEVEHIELECPDPDPPRPYIESLLRGGEVALDLTFEGSDGYEVSVC